MTDHWPLPATRGTTLGRKSSYLRNTARSEAARLMLWEDVKFLRETGESPYMAATRLGKTVTALEKAMRVVGDNELASWFANVYTENCSDCGTPIRGRKSRSCYSGMCTKCAVRASKAVV